MLTKKDIGQIEEVIQNAFVQFFDSIFEPYINRNEQAHTEIIGEIKSMKKEITELKNDVGEVNEYIKVHDKRLDKLEIIARASQFYP